MLLVVLAVTVIVGTTLGGRYRVAPPVLLIGMGALLALIPPLSHVVLDPEVVLLLFLPAILYREALTTSLREIRNNLLVIGLLAVVLVGLTAVTVSLAAQALGVHPGAAWVLGAVLAPTDAAAVSGLAKRMPRRVLTTLRAESLINDGTALVLFSVTVGLLAGGTVPGALKLAGEFSLSFAGGIAAGLVVSGLVVLVRRHIDDPMREGALSVLTPFAAFTLAEQIHASGVLAVVVAGLVLSYAGPRVIRARSRLVAFAFWDLSTFLINGALFVLLGMQIPRAIRSVTSVSFGRAVVIATVVTLVVVLTRAAWLLLSSYPIRVVNPRAKRQPAGIRIRVVAAWTGYRGAVSLAAALAVPLSTHGHQVSERDLIIFCTATAIVAIMLVQGTTLPLIVRWARLMGDPRRVEEVRQARVRAGQAGLSALPQIAEQVGADDDVRDRVRTDYEALLEDLSSAEREEGPPRASERERQLRLGLIEHKRREITRMRDANEIDDVVLRELQAALDIEEVRLLGPEAPE
ncbi:sodium/proton antiporter, CPA1 family [Micromonospora avicenniae]|uniref:Sodium/proton antiporter, CPA1 family n=1 Tax=Micromonospora avicenniae TaxID=1198245 RepID=A0A1N6VAV3_9ACTN|nr:sodium/proton antiporter, CPA1 family [Micromonospora avicenniae]